MPKLSAIIVTHSTSVFGPPNALADYLIRRGVDVLYVDHPLDFDPARQTKVTIWQTGRIVLEKSFPNWLGWRPINYLKDFMITLWILFKYARGQSYRWFFGLDSLACLNALWMKGVIDYQELVAYNADYSTDRFHALMMNLIYRSTDRYTMNRADWIWCVTERIAAIRRAGHSADRIIVVPNGVDIRAVRATGPHNKGLLFIGNLTAEKGVEAILRALTKIKTVSLTIYGQGVDRPRLEGIVRQLGIARRVAFRGQISHKRLLIELANYQAGIALYQAQESYVYYSDPLKVKEYLAAGLPVIISDVPEISKVIDAHQAGVIIREPGDLVDAINQITLRQPFMARAARHLAASYDWDKLFDQAWQSAKWPLLSVKPAAKRRPRAKTA